MAKIRRKAAGARLNRYDRSVVQVFDIIFAAEGRNCLKSASRGN